MSDREDTRVKQGVSAESEALLRERFNSLSRLVPVLYVAIFIDVILLAWLFHDAIPGWANIVLALSVSAVIISRFVYWVRLRGKAYDLDLGKIRRAIRGTAILGPALSLAFSTVGFVLMRQGNATQQSVTLIAIWIVASASSFCVFSLPVTAMLILLASCVPMCLAVLLAGDSRVMMEAPAFIGVSALMIYVLRENHRTFTEIVNSRSKMKRLQEELGQNHKHLARAQQVGLVGSAHVDLRTETVMWSDQLFMLLDLDRATVAPSLEAFVAAGHPDDRAMLRDAIAKNRQGVNAVPMEFRVRRADGTVRWLSWASDLLLSDTGSAEEFVVTVHDITEGKRVELDLVEREAQLRRSHDHLDRAQKLGKIGSNEFHPSTGETWWSDEQYTILGLDPGSVKPDSQVFLDRIHPDDLELLRQRLKTRAQGQTVEPTEYRIVLPDGEVRWVYGQSEAVRDASGATIKVIGTLLDITERKRIEAQLAQAQKMEAVGQLTGGVAHDFNNLLAVILGRMQMLDEELADRAELRNWVRSAIKAVDRGATLTKSLLAFSRRQALMPVELDLNAVVDDIDDMLRQTLGEAYEFRVAKAPELWRVEADAGQLQNTLLNLVLNARDAMPKGGQLAVEIANAALDAGYASGHNEVRAGDYVMVSVSDTGLGMSREVAERAFEPFFTTKDVDKGSGLGLSMVYGFVKQSGGHVTIDSEPGRGTTVRIYLPRKIDAHPVAPAKGAEVRSTPRGTETILVVEDNDELRQLTRLQLERLGYTVLDAAYGAEGLRALRDNPDIDLLLTDVVMPHGMNGPELAELALTMRPDLEVVFMSGYSEQREALERTRGRGPVRWLQKPFHLADLAARIRDALD